MGKKKGKKDSEKKAALQARKEGKAEKAARKRLQKEGKAAARPSSNRSPDDIPADQIEDLITIYKQQDKATSASYVEELEGFPKPRGNASLTVCEGEKGRQDMYMFGGEYFDGVENVVVNQLLRWDMKAGVWKKVVAPVSPPPRCAHSTVYYNQALYVFGGELATSDHYHHYKDLWRYDIPKQTWEECNCRTGTSPSARSGHVAVNWKYFMIVFGGFFEALRDTPKWYNDVCVFNMQTRRWMDIPHNKLASRPEPRSACNVSVIGDTAVFHGGYSKLVGATAGTTESKVHSDAWILHLKPLLQDKPPTWESLLSSSSGKNVVNSRNPNGRAGTACAGYKNRMLVYGGVVDSELLHHKVNSVFYNDLFAFDMEQRKWFPLRVKASNKDSNRSRRRKASNEAETDEQLDDNENDVADVDQDDQDEDEDIIDETDDNLDQDMNSGWDLEKLRSNMFAFIDGDGNIVYERIEEEKDDKVEGTKQGEHLVRVEKEDNYEQKEEEEEKSEDIEEEKEEKEQTEEEREEKEQDKETQTKPKRMNERKIKSISSSSVMKVNQQTKAPEAVERDVPLPRMNASLVVRANTAFIYGGILEVGDREVTLDDMWCFDLRKRAKWECIWSGTMHKQVWRGGIHDDDDSYVSTERNENDGESDEDLDSEEEKTNTSPTGDASSTTMGQRNGVAQEIAELNAMYGLGETSRTPEPAETLADFYGRTRGYWNEQAITIIKMSDVEVEPSNKELKRKGFELAQERYMELEENNVLDRMNELLRDKKEKR